MDYNKPFDPAQSFSDLLDARYKTQQETMLPHGELYICIWGDRPPFLAATLGELELHPQMEGRGSIQDFDVVDKDVYKAIFSGGVSVTCYRKTHTIGGGRL